MHLKLPSPNLTENGAMHAGDSKASFRRVLIADKIPHYMTRLFSPEEHTLCGSVFGGGFPSNPSFYNTGAMPVLSTGADRVHSWFCGEKPAMSRLRNTQLEEVLITRGTSENLSMEEEIN